MKITPRICLICGNEFKPYHNNRPQKYCSWECKAKAQIGRKQPYPGKLYYLNCKICDKEFRVPPCRLKISKYCSNECRQISYRGKKHTKEHNDKIGYWSQMGRNPRWKGGRASHSLGYIWIKQPNHPFADVRGYVLEHRLVVEKQIGRYLEKGEIVHHLKEEKNNSPCFLMAFSSNSAHMRFHSNPANVKTEEIIFDGRNIH